MGKTFPYSFEFLYWEEVGIIDQELIRNLAICSACIIVMIGLLIPHPKIAIFVILAILLSVLLGGAHGLIFLPTMLSIFVGDKPMSTTSPRPVKNSAVAADDVKEIEMSNVEVEADKTDTTI